MNQANTIPNKPVTKLIIVAINPFLALSDSSIKSSEEFSLNVKSLEALVSNSLLDSLSLRAVLDSSLESLICTFSLLETLVPVEFVLFELTETVLLLLLQLILLLLLLVLVLLLLVF